MELMETVLPSQNWKGVIWVDVVLCMVSVEQCCVLTSEITHGVISLLSTVGAPNFKAYLYRSANCDRAVKVLVGEKLFTVLFTPSTLS